MRKIAGMNDTRPEKNVPGVRPMMLGICGDPAMRLSSTTPAKSRNRKPTLRHGIVAS
jgi:hypothetical protein